MKKAELESQRITEIKYVLLLLVYDYAKVGHKDINENTWLIQTDLEGNKIWDLVLPGEEDDKAMALCKIDAGVVFVAGYTYSDSKGRKDFY